MRQTAGPDPHRIAAAMRAADRKVPGALRRGFARSLRPLDAEVRRQAEARFPSGYAPVFNASVETRLSLHTSGDTAQADVRIYATGQTDRRRVTDLNAGILAHPVFGRYRQRRWTATRPRRRLATPQRLANPWARQRIQAGFADAAVEAMRPGIRQAMADVIDEVDVTIREA